MKRVVNTRNSQVIVTHLEQASSMRDRLVGLIGRKDLPQGHGFWIERSGNSIHTFFMKFPIDVLFVNKKGIVKHMASHIKPWRLIVAKTLVPTDCLELPAGTIDKCDTRTGDTLRVEITGS